MIVEKLSVNNLSWFLFKCNILIAVTYAGLNLYERYVNWTKKRGIHEVLFTRQIDCKHCVTRKRPDCDNQHCYSYTLRKMKSLIDGAQHSLYICLNVFTSVELGEVVLHAHRRGVSVKIIGNNTTDFASGSQLLMLHENGEFWMFTSSYFIIHSKF